jgi:hypothetical protein
MRAFTCQHCGQLLFFENTLCLRCGTPQGFDPEPLDLVTLEPGSDLAAGYVACANRTVAECNWKVRLGDPEPLCRSCRLTRTRPNDDDAAGLAELATAEAAKRRLLFQLYDLGLPVEGEGLEFDLLSSRAGPVVTGHDDGLITIDLAESDDARREQRRAQLGEPYRTLLGHFRHEIGHFYQPIIVDRAGFVEAGRALFGDERLDYEVALQRHYEQGPPPDWRQRHVSAYATMHPWEDWAETFAHYLHIRDTLQTAGAFGMLIVGPAGTSEQADPSLIAAPAAEAEDEDIETVVGDWLPLTYALNAVNRSMGRDDLYPFTLAPAVIEKLGFVHARVRAAGVQARAASSGR